MAGGRRGPAAGLDWLKFLRPDWLEEGAAGRGCPCGGFFKGAALQTVFYVCVCMYVYVCMCTYVCAYVFLCMYVCVCVHVCVYIRVCVCIYVCVCICIDLCVYMYVHVYIGVCLRWGTGRPAPALRVQAARRQPCLQPIPGQRGRDPGAGRGSRCSPGSGASPCP